MKSAALVPTSAQESGGGEEEVELELEHLAASNDDNAPTSSGKKEEEGEAAEHQRRVRCDLVVVAVDYVPNTGELLAGASPSVTPDGDTSDEANATIPIDKVYNRHIIYDALIRDGGRERRPLMVILKGFYSKFLWVYFKGNTILTNSPVLRIYE